MVVWRAVHVGPEGDGLVIGGVAVWEHIWRWTSEPPLELAHPSYPEQMHRYRVCEIRDLGVVIRFAAGELSNGVWGFYVPLAEDEAGR